MNRIFVIFALLLAFVAQVHAQKEQSFMLTGTVFDEFCRRINMAWNGAHNDAGHRGVIG